MAGSIQLYTQPEHQGMQTFPLASFTTTDLRKGTDYQENYKVKFNAPLLDKDIWAVKLTINTTGLQNLQVNKSYSPIPETSMIQNNRNLVPSNCDLSAPFLTTKPADWELHWRDKYNKTIYTDISDDNFDKVYRSSPILAPSRSGTPYDPPFEADTYKQTNQGRYLFWTMSDFYFAIEGFWVYTLQGIHYGVEYTVRPFFTDTSASSANRAYSNCFRERSVSGNYCPTQTIQANLAISMSDFTQGANQAISKAHINFINFNYDIENPTTHEIETKEMLGFVVWRTGADGIPIAAQIAAFEKDFWKGLPDPPNDGPTSYAQGGHGSFSAPSNDRGDRTGDIAHGIASAWNSNTMSSGYNNYYLSPSVPIPFQEMCERLWDPGIIESWINQAQSPLQAIITCHQIPETLAPRVLGSYEPIKAAGLTLSDTAVATFSQYITSYHVGDVDISPYTDAFPDFTNTSIYIHLPYIGTYQIDTAACMHGWLAVDYLCDVTSGHCTALITTKDKFDNTEIRYEFKGDCSKTVPLYQRENPWAKAIGAVLPTVVGTLVSAATSGVVAGGSASKIADRLMDDYGVIFDEPGMKKGLVNTIKPALQRNGAMSGALGTIASSATSAALSGGGTVQSNASGGDVTSPIDTQCWILITRPQWSAPELYSRERGYPSDISGAVGDFSGLLMVSTCELNGIDCTDQELHEIDSWLRSGVLLN